MTEGGISRREFSLGMLAGGCFALGCPGCLSGGRGLRYACKGELHRDFHASILDGVNYLLDNYGEAAAREVLSVTAREVYRTMREKLSRGASSELVEWWRYYLEREGGVYRLEEGSDGSAVLSVDGGPALAHLEKRGISGGRRVCWATRVLNEALAADSPFRLVLEETDGGCRQRLSRKTDGGAV